MHVFWFVLASVVLLSSTEPAPAQPPPGRRLHSHYDGARYLRQLGLAIGFRPDRERLSSDERSDNGYPERAWTSRSGTRCVS